MRRGVPFLAAVLAILTVGCAAESTVSDSAPPLTVTDSERVVFVALGSDETVNRDLDDPLRDAWPQLLFKAALPRSAVYVNFARGGSTAEEALEQQVPEALAMEPTLATVWLGSGDEEEQTSELGFERDLTEITARLQGVGARVLLITTARDGLADVVERVATATSASVVVVPDVDRRTDEGQQMLTDAIASQLGA